MEWRLDNPPQDTISSISFSRTNPNLLLVISWDGSATLFDVEKNCLVDKYDLGSSLLDGTFGVDDNVVYVGGVSKTITRITRSDKHARKIGFHDREIKCVAYFEARIISGSWDKTICIWNDSGMCLHRLLMDERVYSLDISRSGILVVALAEKQLAFVDPDRGVVLEKRDSAIQYQIRSVRCSPVDDVFVYSTIEGRVAIEHFDKLQTLRYAFKCHRATGDDGKELVYPVNAVCFHPTHGTFLTGGSDGIVNSWDGAHKKKIRAFPPYPCGISALAFNSTGNILAVASSYLYEQGEKDHPPDSIFVQNVQEADIKPRFLPK